MEVKELDRVKFKDGRVATILGIYSDGIGAEVEFDDAPIGDDHEMPDLVDLRDVVEIIWKSTK